MASLSLPALARRTRAADVDRPRSILTRTADDVFALAGAAIGSLALDWLVYEQLLAFSGRLGFLLCWYVGFLFLYSGLTALTNPFPVVIDRIAATWIHAAAVVVATGLGSAIVFMFVRGWTAMHHVNFYTHDMAGVGPQDPLTRGGVEHAIVGSAIEVLLAVVASVPLGLATAIYLTEVGGRLATLVRTVIEAMTALPSIVAGLFIYTTLIVEFGLPRTGFTASMALTVMMFPIVARAAEVQLRVVASGLREASLALGASHLRTVLLVVLPTARAGLMTAVILAIARGVGETSPVLLTSGASTFFNAHPLKDPMNSLPLFVFSSVRSGEPLYIARGFGAVSVLLALVLLSFALMRYVSRPRRGSR
jgi:phosphate transport system permease protein